MLFKFFGWNWWIYGFVVLEGLPGNTWFCFSDIECLLSSTIIIDAQNTFLQMNWTDIFLQNSSEVRVASTFNRKYRPLTTQYVFCLITITNINIIFSRYLQNCNPWNWTVTHLWTNLLNFYQLQTTFFDTRSIDKVHFHGIPSSISSTL